MVEGSLDSIELLGLACRDGDVAVPVADCAREWEEAVVVGF